MSQMSPKQRRQIIRENIIQKTTKQIAVMCNVTKRTITRDILKWKQEGGFEEFLMDEFLKSYPHIKETFPEKAFDRLCYLLGKTITQKREVKQDIDIQEKQEVIVTLESLSPAERDFLQLVARKYIKAGNKRKPDPLH